MAEVKIVNGAAVKMLAACESIGKICVAADVGAGLVLVEAAKGARYAIAIGSSKEPNGHSQSTAANPISHYVCDVGTGKIPPKSPLKLCSSALKLAKFALERMKLCPGLCGAIGTVCPPLKWLTFSMDAVELAFKMDRIKAAWNAKNGPAKIICSALLPFAMTALTFAIPMIGGLWIHPLILSAISTALGMLRVRCATGIGGDIDSFMDDAATFANGAVSAALHVRLAVDGELKEIVYANLLIAARSWSLYDLAIGR